MISDLSQFPVLLLTGARLPATVQQRKLLPSLDASYRHRLYPHEQDDFRGSPARREMTKDYLERLVAEWGRPAPRQWSDGGSSWLSASLRLPRKPVSLLGSFFGRTSPSRLSASAICAGLAGKTVAAASREIPAHGTARRIAGP